MKKIVFLFLLFVSIVGWSQRAVGKLKTSVLVIGGGAGGTAAAIQSARLGAKTILIEPTTMLGGMLTAAGVSCTDGNDQLPSGIWEEFRQALYQHYGKKKLNTGWVSNTNFEPQVADSIFKAWVKKEKNLNVYYGYQFETVYKNGNTVTGAGFEKLNEASVLKIEADIVIDGTELGDVLAAAGAAYDLGMDDPALSGEKEARQKNNIIQDLTWAAVLKDYGPGADKTIPKPANYQPELYDCCCTDAPCNGTPWNGDKLKMLNYGKLPKSPGEVFTKYMLNWPPHGNDIYLNVVEATNEERAIAYEKAKQHTLGFIYYLQTVLGLKNIGLADDELDGGLALIPYNREGRRVKGVVRFTLNHIKAPYNYNLYRTGIAVGDYPVDHHHARYPGHVPEVEFPPIPAFSVPMGVLIPETVDGLLVCEKGISVTNLVNGTTRLQPVVMLTGQAAGVLAAKAVQRHGNKMIGIRNVTVRGVQESLLKAGAYLLPFTDVKPDHPFWQQIQRIGVTGLLRGTGIAKGWGNQQLFYPDSIIAVAAFEKNVKDYYPSYQKISEAADFQNRALRIADAFQILDRLYLLISKEVSRYPDVMGDFFQKGDREKTWSNMGLKAYDETRAIKRFELAMLFDSILDPFAKKSWTNNITGN